MVLFTSNFYNFVRFCKGVETKMQHTCYFDVLKSMSICKAVTCTFAAASLPDDATPPGKEIEKPNSAYADDDGMYVSKEDE